MSGLKSVIGAVCVAALVSSSAFAADALAPGKPAGVKHAQLSDGTLLVGAAAVGIIAAVAIVVSSQNTDHSQPLTSPPVTISSTSTG